MDTIESSDKPIWPNFFIVGAAKAGTTSLYNYLKQNEELFMPEVKEPNFFAMYEEKLNHSNKLIDKYPACSRDIYYRIKKNSVTKINEYLQLFCEGKGKKGWGEASTLYLLHPRSPERINKFVPNAKIIAILRNPIERSFSSYMHLVNVGFEKRSFKQALADEPYDTDDVWFSNGPYYIRPGFYFKGLSRYYQLFGTNRIRIHLYDTFKDDPTYVINDIFQFLEVDSTFKPDTSKRYNVSGIPKGKLHEIVFFMMRSFLSSRVISDLLSNSIYYNKYKHNIRRIKNRFLLKRMEIPTAEKEFLKIVYENDIINLEKLIKKDLNQWLNV